jgi:hypothetical protein
MNPIRSLITDDYPFFRRALKAHLEENSRSLVVGMAANGQIDGLGGTGLTIRPSVIPIFRSLFSPKTAIAGMSRVVR